jgi:carbonic anhydrase
MELSRTTFLSGVSALVAATAVPAAAEPLSDVDPVAEARGTSAQALAFLRAGNYRFVRTGPRPWPTPLPPPAAPTPLPRRPTDRTPQRPWAALLTCADTRVAPEFVFDAGFGDLFVCRAAGNIADNDVTGSIEYAVAEFHAPLVVVVGHSGCGACDAAIKTFDGKLFPPANILAVVRAIMPAVSTVPHDDSDRLRHVVEHNARLTAAALAAGPILKPAIVSGRLHVTWGYHELKSGVVTIR